jgi:hypothetical protein
MRAKKPVSIPMLIKKALDLFSQYYKLRAASEGRLYCFTCGAPLQLHTSNCQLGHYLSRGGYSAMTFEPDNCRLQCFRCNIHLKGNIVEFRIKLVAEIGIEKVEFMEANRHSQMKWSRSQLHELIDQFSQAIKEL